MSALATPVVLLTGVEPSALDVATITLQFDLPEAVVVRHELDAADGSLTRTVSDVTGRLERERVELEHACVSCAIREDVVPTLARLAELGRWRTIVAVLPAAAEPLQVCRVVALDDEVAGLVRIASVVASLAGSSLVDALTGDALLVERDLHTTEDDRRGLAEVAGALVEQADVVAVQGDSLAEGRSLLSALTRPGARVARDGDSLGANELTRPGLHDHEAMEAWVDEARTDALPATPPGVWRLDLRSDRPFHPERLHERLEEIGSGAHRSRGCFWLPTRPDVVCGWDGAGGQVSIGGIGQWGLGPQHTRIVITGLESLTSRAERLAMRRAFEACVLTDEEMRVLGPYWDRRSDGFEPWLGAIRAIA